MIDFLAARTHMVDGQIRTAGVNVPEILQAFEAVPRERFVPEHMQGVAYRDEDLPLGDGRFLLAPMLHAKMVQALQPSLTDVVLDIGGATGYSAAIFSSLVTTVVALDENQAYLDHAVRVWDSLGVCNAVALQGEHNKGAPAHAPFDLIFINGAVSEIPAHLLAQLSPGGRLIAVVRKPDSGIGDVVVIRNLDGGGSETQILFNAACPYLSGFEPVPTFNF